ncbi:ATP-dependent DNA ligase [Streptomyces noursei ZPM]|uniref:DNA ligase (ATP) n=1 Tax=Streptomyces noursei TaxID=1971 RepID=A0A401RAE4_STRNR|nr:non-homologous end-joining DNA ligase [Streptomyces noursei]AKA06737.1 ATP-dependent DNA ligase [Streptomyces noursei ZPM]EPY93306.1 ATP-dependent DNA ligase [Streptomyces noursei CCRC 11814]EXU92630.1 ATP-dependent DNA ligase [Streptomyces noursei PD-1]UWS75274.1 non-homologous end-joining DNA ligase [Streptomyces noursei]GCB94557.1 ATP-dependent DNA ligase [Streptomyces noursei]
MAPTPGGGGAAPPLYPVIRPMLAVLGPLPPEHEQADWAFEAKWDGARCLVNAPGDGTIRLVTRAGNDATTTYPELGPLGQQLRGRPAVLDGEVVVLDPSGRPDFGLLQRRMGVLNPRRTARLAMELPAQLVLFDVMYLAGPLVDAPYHARRAVLEGLGLAGPNWSVPGYLAGHGDRAWQAALRGGLEGVVAKRLSSPYLPGVRSPDWVKTKHVESLDVVIGGWTEGHGALGGLPGSVLAGVVEPDGLRFVGAVGSGLSDAERRELASYLGVIPLDRSPFVNPVDQTGVHWTEPRLVAEITFSGWTSAGRIRHPVWHRLRPDLTRLG